MDGHVKIEARESGGNKFIVAYNRTTPYSVSQSFHLKKGLYYAFSGKNITIGIKENFIFLQLILKNLNFIKLIINNIVQLGFN